VRASSTVVTITITLIPRAWQRRTCSGLGLPRPIDQTGTRSSTITSNAASMMSGTAGGLAVVGGRPRRVRKPLSVRCTSRTVGSGIEAGSAGGRSESGMN